MLTGWFIWVISKTTAKKTTQIFTLLYNMKINSASENSEIMTELNNYDAIIGVIK